jgi:predicted membrane protein
MKLEPKPPKPLIFRKIRPKYRKILIPFLILSFIVAVVLLVFFYRYFFKPAFQKKGSLEPAHTLVVEKFERRLKFKV